ncbi:hypothetical protein SLEP1_g15052 [Rubroshorea leprosula]|uniref:Uncharacterized protein n=1 Tax=Rubroshorea leprosula TaxID=152421 RepID=A0AAV5IQH5_9ROSI|nr:hypothetical protein SLEP1_g15052 [Rubroshorea leprosula]
MGQMRTGQVSSCPYLIEARSTMYLGKCFIVSSVQHTYPCRN